MQQPPNPYPQNRQFLPPALQSQQQPDNTQPQTYYPPQQPPIPPKKRTDKIVLAVIGAVVSIFILAIIIAIANTSAAHNLNATATANAHNLNATAIANNATVSAGLTAITSDQTQTAMTPTAIPTTPVSTTSQTGVSSTQTSGVWTITVNSIKTVVSTNEFEVPKAGDEFIAINFTAVNTDTAAHEMNPFYFTLRDDAGTSYDFNPLTIAANPDGTVVSGQKLRGDLTYEIPKSMHSLTLQFDTPDDLDKSQIIQWNLTV
jgi:hypothetical protein